MLRSRAVLIWIPPGDGGSKASALGVVGLGLGLGQRQGVARGRSRGMSYLEGYLNEECHASVWDLVEPFFHHIILNIPH